MVIDSAIVLAILIITSPFTFFVSLFLFPFFYAAIDFIYRTATLSMGSATFGMRIMAIELRHESGHRLDFITRFFIPLAFMCPMPLFWFNSYQLA